MHWSPLVLPLIVVPVLGRDSAPHPTRLGGRNGVEQLEISQKPSGAFESTSFNSDNTQQHGGQTVFYDSDEYLLEDVASSIPPPHTDYMTWINHTSEPRSDTSSYIRHKLRLLHPPPQFHMTTTSSPYFNIFSYAANHPEQLKIRSVPEKNHLIPSTLIKKVYLRSARLVKGGGQLADDITWGAYELDFSGERFFVYLASWAEGFVQNRDFYIFHENSQAISSSAPDPVTDSLILSVSNWVTSLHDEMLVFDLYWDKDASLYRSVRKANWDDVILDKEMKDTIREDVEGFFKKRKIYQDLGVPYKRGILFVGPPGNGKTISLKAIMHSLQDFQSSDGPIPSLYVKSFRTFTDDESGIREIFQRARLEAPCLLVMEDMDALITDYNRSFFLNEVDGLESNDGVLIIGTTNHFDRLDPGLADRPSRFDRKYVFPNPNLNDRIQYCKYWQNKLKDNDFVDFPNSLVQEASEMTHGFSFAYLKEAFVSTLLGIASNDAPEKASFPKLLKDQIKTLRRDIPEND